MKTITLCLAGLAALALSQDWAVKYTSGPSSNDEAHALAVDRSGNCYVLGQCGQAILVKYSPRGETLWTRTTPDSGWYYLHDVDVALDAQGNPVVVAAVSIGDSTGFHLAKYQSSGVPAWSTTYWPSINGGSASGPLHLGVTAAGDVYVAGTTRSDSRDVLTCRFSPAGILRWARTIDGPRHSTDAARGLAMVNAGRIVVPAIVTDAANHANLSALCYDSAGTLLWDYYYMRDANYKSDADECVVGPGGNVYVVGWRSSTTDAENELLLVKLGPNGDSLWAVTDSTGRNLLQPSAVADTAGNVYVVAAYSRNDTVAMRTWKYSPSGTKLWHRDCRDADSVPTWGVDAVLAGDQSVYACGVRNPGLWRRDYLVTKYNPDGTEAWSTFVPGSDQCQDLLVAGAADANDNIIVTGTSDSLTFSRKDFLTMKFRSTGGIEEYGASPVPRTALRVTPTVAASGCRFELADVGSPATLRIADLAGRTVTELPVTRPGTSARWNLTGPDGRAVPNGVYFAVADLPGARTTARFIVQR